MNRKELNDILENHEKWLEGEEGGAFATWRTGSAWCLWGLVIVYGMVEVI